MRSSIYLSLAILSSLTACNGTNTTDSFTDLSNAEQKVLTNDMAVVDKPYVSTLFYSNMTASGPIFFDAKKTLSVFEGEWNSFNNTHKNTFDTSGWVNHFSDIDADLVIANSHYESIKSFPADLTTTHLAMEDVREVMKTIRTNVGIDNYFMDTVTDTHHKMGAVSKAYAVYNASSDSLAISQLKSALSTHLPVFVAAVKQLKSEYGDGLEVATLYGLSASKSERLSKNISNTDPLKPGLLQIVSNLEKALVDNNNPNIVQLSSKVKGKFVSIFLSFGDFVTPFKKDIISLQKSIIPLLYCTGNPPDAGAVCLKGTSNTKDGTLAYVNATRAAYNSFKMHFPSNSKINVPKLLGWTDHFSTIDDSLTSASDTLIAASDLMVATNNGAHIDAESVRDSYYNLIASFEGTSTVMTRMDEYHSAFGKILKTIMDNNVSAADVATIQGFMPNLQTTFDVLSNTMTNADKTEWGIENVDLPALLNPQQININKLSDELSKYSISDNSALIMQRAKALKGLYVPLFKKFGAF